MYIGSSKDLHKRWNQHQWFLKRGEHHNRHLQNAWNKYNGDLTFNTLLICTEDNLLLYEQQFLDFYKPVYNIAQSADKAFYALGVKRSDETKQKISKANTGKSRKGHPCSEKTKEILRQNMVGNTRGLGNTANLGRKLTPEHSKNIGNGLRGRSMSEIQRKQLSDNRKGSNNPMFGKTPWNKKNVA